MGVSNKNIEAVRAEMERLNYEVLYHNVSDFVKITATAVGKSLSAWEDRKVISSISSRLKTPQVFAEN